MNALALFSLEFTDLGRQLNALSVVKICFVVFVFPHCCLPLFHLEELFPFSAWKQAPGQQQVSLFLVVRSLGQPLFVFFLPTMSQSTPIVQIMFCPQLQIMESFHVSCPSFSVKVFVHVTFPFKLQEPISNKSRSGLICTALLLLAILTFANMCGLLVNRSMC